MSENDLPLKIHYTHAELQAAWAEYNEAFKEKPDTHQCMRRWTLYSFYCDVRDGLPLGYSKKLMRFL